MAYTLQPDETISEGIKRIILERVDQSVDYLVNPDINRDEGVHEARKNFKRIRAALRLVRDEIGEKVYRRENVCYRDCSRLLAPARDSYVMLETVDVLTDYYASQLPLDAFSDVRENLKDRYHEISRRVLYETNAIEEVNITLQKARKRVFDLPIGREDFSAFKKGLKRVYKRGRKARARAFADPHPEAFHEWRKRVKYLWYHMDILELLWPTMLDNLADEIHELSNFLGDDHDLAVLRHTLVENPHLLTDEKELLALVSLIDQRRTELEVAARPLGERIYFDKPKAFVRRIAGYWQTWQEEEDAKATEKLKTDVLLSETAQKLAEGAFLSTKQLGEHLGIPPERVRAFIAAGKLPAAKVGQDWVIEANPADLLQNEQNEGKAEISAESLADTKKAADYLGVTPREVRAMINDGDLPAFKVGRSWIIKMADLKEVG